MTIAYNGNSMIIKKTINKIDPNREYSLLSMQREGLFPWAKHRQTIRNMVKKDYWGANVLKARISGEGAGTDYAIKGRNIIKFIKKYGEGLMLGPFQK